MDQVESLHICTLQIQSKHVLAGGALSNLVLIPVALKTLCPTAVLDYDLYLWANDKSDPVLFRERRFPFTRQDIDRLLNASVQTLYLPIEDHVRYRRQLQEGIVDSKIMRPLEQYRALKSSTAVPLKRLRTGTISTVWCT